MSFFKKIVDFLFPTPKMQDFGFWVTVKCNRCGEVLKSRVNLANDLSSDYSDNPAAGTFYCRKVIMGDSLCFQKIEVELNFNSKRKLTGRSIVGGEFVDD